MYSEQIVARVYRITMIDNPTPEIKRFRCPLVDVSKVFSLDGLAKQLANKVMWATTDKKSVGIIFAAEYDIECLPDSVPYLTFPLTPVEQTDFWTEFARGM